MKKIVHTTLFLFGIFLSSGLNAQNDKTVLAFSKSLEFEKKSDFANAIKSLKDLQDSTSYEINLRLGWLNYKAGYKKKSLAHYENAIKSMPNAIEPRIGYGFPAYALEDFNDLIEQDKKILDIDPNNKATNSNLGSIYYYAKDYKKALPYFQKVANLYPFDYNTNLMLAWTYLRLEKNTEAEQFFNNVLLYSPTDASAKEGLESITRKNYLDEQLLNAFVKSYELSDKSKYTDALAAIKSVYDKSSYIINLRLGWLNYLAGAYVESANYYKIASELKPLAIEPKFGCAIPIEAMGNKNDLKLYYDAILSLDPQNTVAHYKLGYLYYQQKDYQNAYTHFEKVVGLFPFDYDGLLMLGWTNYQLGKTPESKALFNKVLCVVPNDKSALQALSLKSVEEENKAKSNPLKIK